MRRARKAAASRSKLSSSRATIWPANSSSISAKVNGAASRMRAETAPPAISAMARYGSRASASCRFQHRPAPVRHHERTRPAARLRDAVGIGEGQHLPGLRRLVVAAPPAGRIRPAPCEPAHVFGAPRTVPAKRLDAMREVGAVSAKPALHDERSDIRGVAACPRRPASTSIRARRGGSGSALMALPSSVRRPSASMASISRSSAAASVSAGTGGGSRKASERGSVTPQAAQSSMRPERSADRISGSAKAFECAGAGFLPEPIADAGLGPACAAPALVGRGARHAHGLQPGEADGRLEARHAGKTAVDDDAHALDGQRRLGDGRGQHHLAPAWAGRLEREILRPLVHRAVERSEIDVGIADPLLQPFLNAPDLALAGQEHEHASPARLARRAAPRPPSGPRCATRIAAEIARLDRKRAALAFMTGALPSSAATRAPSSVADIDQDAQVLPQAALACRAPAQGRDRRRASARGTRRTARRATPESSGSSRIMRVNTPSVTTSIRVFGPNLRAEPHAKSDRLADRFGQGTRHALRRGPRREPARLQQDDLASVDPGLVQQRERHARRLARARRRDEHRRVACAQGSGQAGEGLVDRQGFVERAHARGLAEAGREGKARRTCPP